MTQQPDTLKILAIGSPLGALGTLAQKVTAINSKHGPFAACVISGDVFGPSSDGSELEGVSLPVPTYFTIGRERLPTAVQESIAGGSPEIAPNLIFIGKTSVLTTPAGLKIAAVGGVYDATLYDSEDQDAYSPVITKAGIASLLSNPLFASASDPTSFEAAKASASLPHAFHGVDVLLTSSPPPSLSLLSPSFPSLAVPLSTPAPPLAEVVKRSRPRYMFWSDGEGFWEREPWGWHGVDGKDERWTRAIKLGHLGAPPPAQGKPARWFYAFSLPPQTSTANLPVRPLDSTPNPFTMASTPSVNKRPALESQLESMKKSKTEAASPPESYVCKICQTSGHWIQDCPSKDQQVAEQDPNKPPPGYTCNLCQSPDHFIRACPQRGDIKPSRQGRKPPPGYVCKACGETATHFIKECPVVKQRDQERSRKKELGPEECWFCLSNPKVTKHLIVAIGSEAYVTLPKGQLIPTHGDKPLVPGGGHVLIIPIAHHPTLLSIPPADAMDIISEIEAYKSSLRQCYAQYNAVPVTFEVGRLAGRGGHAHVQVLPVPAELADQVAEHFIRAGEATGIDWEPEAERALARVGPTGNYFKVECPDGKKLVHLLKGNFDLQFGRMVLAGVLGLHHRANWKDCTQTDAEDKDDAQKFKKALAPFLPK